MMEVTVSKKGNLDADQVRVCACRNFLKDNLQHINGFMNPVLAIGILVPGMTVTDHTVPKVADFGMVCKAAAARNNWTDVVKLMNDPKDIVPRFKAANITGQEHCAKSWIIKGACAEVVNVKETSLLQHKLSTEDKIDAAIHRHEQSVGNRILTAVANGSGDTICVEAAVGDIAPVPGSFTATTSQQAVEVAAGTAAVEKGSFCVAKATVLLLQRTHSLYTADDIESALTTKDSTTATTTTTLATSAAEVSPNAENFATFDFAGDAQKKVRVKQCPDKSSTLTQMMEVTVSKKGNLDADQVRVCACRNFLKDNLQHINGFMNPVLAIGILVPGMTVTDHTVPKVADFGMVCKAAAARNNWTDVVKLMNDPKDIVPRFKAANITGQEHCAKSWIIKGACAEVVNVKETSLLQHKLSTEDKIDAAIHRHEQSVGNRILTAVANGSGDTICVEAAVGDIAPVPGSFTATTSQQAVEVAAGTAAVEKGSFCVAKATVLLLQRTHSLYSAKDIESALTTKDTTT